jgi:hypothetical protein
VSEYGPFEGLALLLGLFVLAVVLGAGLRIGWELVEAIDTILTEAGKARQAEKAEK